MGPHSAMACSQPCHRPRTHPIKNSRRYRKLVAWMSLILVVARQPVPLGIGRGRPAAPAQRGAGRSYQRAAHRRTRSTAVSTNCATFPWRLRSTWKTPITFWPATIPRRRDAGPAKARSGASAGAFSASAVALSNAGPAPPHKDFDAMAAAYEELGSIQTTYSRELLRFGSELAPRLDRINKRVDQIGERPGRVRLACRSNPMSEQVIPFQFPHGRRTPSLRSTDRPKQPSPTSGCAPKFSKPSRTWASPSPWRFNARPSRWRAKAATSWCSRAPVRARPRPSPFLLPIGSPTPRKLPAGHGAVADPRAGPASGGRNRAHLRDHAARGRSRLRRVAHGPADRAAARWRPSRLRHARAHSRPHPPRHLAARQDQVRGPRRVRRDALHGLPRGHREHPQRNAAHAPDPALLRHHSRGHPAPLPPLHARARRR